MAYLTNIEKAAVIFALIAGGTPTLGQSSESQWRKFASREGAFSVLMPGKPKAESQSLVTNGVKMAVHSFSVWSRTNGKFTVSYVDAPMLPTTVAGERMLDAQRQALTQGDEGRMLSAEKLTVNGYSARQYKARTEDGSQADEKLYLVRRRLYILLVVHDRDRDEDGVKKFFDSFTFEPRE